MGTKQDPRRGTGGQDDARGDGINASVSEALDIARSLATAGIPVFVAYPDPAKPGDYKPRGEWQKTSPNPAYVNAWKPGLALCAVMGQGLDLIDIDPRNGGDTQALNGIMPEVLAVAATPAGGEHLFVASMGVRSRDDVLPGIDVKAGDLDGQGRGFAFIAPTVRVSKTTGERVAYRWVTPPDLGQLGTGDGSGEKLAALIGKRRAGGTSEGDGTGWTDPDIDALIEHGIPGGVSQDARLRDVVWKLRAQFQSRPVIYCVWQAIVARTTLKDPGRPWTGADFERHWLGADRKQGNLIYHPPGHSPDPTPPSPDPPQTSLLSQLRDALIDSDNLDRLPIPEPLIDGLLYRDSLAWLHGKPGHCKSFVALDFACCIDAGLPWMKRPVTQGPVLYVIAEGATGLRPRVRAWEDRAGQKTGVRFLPVAVQMLHTGHTEAFAELAAELQCVLVVLDTQARVTVGADENSAVDMGPLVAAAEKIRVATRACVKFVHHEARAGDNMRGSTALEGAATTILRVVKDGPRLELTNPKQKDAAEADPLTLWVTPRLQSVVIADQPYGPTLDLRADSENKILNTLLDMFETTGASATNLREATGLPKSTFFYALNRLVKDGLVQNLGTRARSCYVRSQASLPGEVQQVQPGPSPAGPMSNATTEGVALDHRTPWTTGPRLGESPLGYAQRLSHERAEATP
jgi:hypothetical protein